MINLITDGSTSNLLGIDEASASRNDASSPQLRGSNTRQDDTTTLQRPVTNLRTGRRPKQALRHDTPNRKPASPLRSPQKHNPVQSVHKLFLEKTSRGAAHSASTLILLLQNFGRTMTILALILFTATKASAPDQWMNVPSRLPAAAGRYGNTAGNICFFASDLWFLGNRLAPKLEEIRRPGIGLYGYEDLNEALRKIPYDPISAKDGTTGPNMTHSPQQLTDMRDLRESLKIATDYLFARKVVNSDTAKREMRKLYDAVLNKRGFGGLAINSGRQQDCQETLFSLVEELGAGEFWRINLEQEITCCHNTGKYKTACNTTRGPKPLAQSMLLMNMGSPEPSLSLDDLWEHTKNENGKKVEDGWICGACQIKSTATTNYQVPNLKEGQSLIISVRGQ